MALEFKICSDAFHMADILGLSYQCSVAELKLFSFGSSSGSTFSIILAPALYCH